jgi:hypothetical protein
LEIDYGKIMEELEKFVTEFCSKLPEPKSAEKRIRRIKNFAVQINEDEEGNEEIIEVASLLYGIARYDPGAATDLLGKLELDEDEKELVKECLETIQSPCNDNSEPEVKVIQSADVLALLSDDDWVEEHSDSMESDELISYLKKLTRRICNEVAEDKANDIISDVKDSLD